MSNADCATFKMPGLCKLKQPESFFFQFFVFCLFFFLLLFASRWIHSCVNVDKKIERFSTQFLIITSAASSYSLEFSFCLQFSSFYALRSRVSLYFVSFRFQFGILLFSQPTKIYYRTSVKSKKLNNISLDMFVHAISYQTMWPIHCTIHISRCTINMCCICCLYERA